MTKGRANAIAPNVNLYVEARQVPATIIQSFLSVQTLKFWLLIPALILFYESFRLYERLVMMAHS